MSRRNKHRNRQRLRIEAAGGSSSIIAIGGDVSIEAASAEKKGPCKFDVLAYSGGVLPGALRQGDSRKDVILDLAGVRQARSLVANLDHNPSQRVGNVTAVSNDGKELRLSGLASAATASRDEVVASANDGFIWQASVEAEPLRLETIKAGKPFTVNGQSFVGPAIVAREAILKGFGFVSHGADDNTTVNIAATAAGSKSGVFSMIFDTWIAAKGFDPAELTDAQKVTLKAAFDAEKKQDPPKVEAGGEDPIKQLRADQAAEVYRVNGIRKVCAAYPDAEVKAADGSMVPIEAHAIAEGWTADATELAALRVARPAPAVHAKSRDGESTLQALQGAMVMRAGYNLDDKIFTTSQAQAMKLPGWIRAGLNTDLRQKAMEAAYRFRDMSMYDVAIEAIRIDGKDVPSGSRRDILEAAFSGSALANIFTTNVNTVILATYMEATDTTGGWVREADVADFKSNERPRMVKGPNLSRLPPGQTADHVTRSDLMEQYKVYRYAKQFVVDEQDFINDSFGAMNDTPQEMGLAAARLRPDLVYYILMSNPTLAADSVALFHSSHANLNTSATFSATTLKTAIRYLELQTENGVNLNLKASHVIVPPALKHLAAELINSSTILYGGDDEAVRGTTNTLAAIESLSLVVDARLENGVTDPLSGTTSSGSATTWFMASKMGHNIEVGYLRGTGRAPSVRSFTLDRGQWGIGWDVKHDIGAKALDYRGLSKNTA